MQRHLKAFLKIRWFALGLGLFAFAPGVLLTVPADVYANSNATTAIQSLLSQHRRPEIKDIEAALKGVSVDDAINAVRAVYPHSVEQQTSANILHLLPEAIARMEVSFPGGIWAPLGRDTSNFGDALDAFYRTMGQSGRVRRINLSTSAFTGRAQDIVDYFADSIGYRMTPEVVAAHPPLIMFDNTSYGGRGQGNGTSGSQSNMIMTALYAAYQANGGKRTDLLPRLNMMRNGASFSDPKQFLSQQEIVMNSNPNQVAPSYLMDVTIAAYGKEWHMDWLSMKNINGKVDSTPGVMCAEQNKASILYDMLLIMKEVRTPEFMKRVTEACTRVGAKLEFDNEKLKKMQEEMERELKRANEARAEELRGKVREFIAGLDSEIASLVKGLPVLPPADPWEKTGEKAEKETKTGYLSDAAKELKKWMEDSIQKVGPYASVDEKVAAAGSNIVTAKVIRGAAQAYQEGKIRSKDLRRLLAYALGLSNLKPGDRATQEFTQAVAKICDTYSKLKEVFSGRAEFFETVYDTAIKENAPKRAKGLENTKMHYRLLFK